MRWLELGEDGYYHPKDDGQPDPDLGPLLFDLADCEIFVRYILLDICTRDSPDNWPTKPPLKGVYTQRTGDTHLRGSDRTLRIFVSVAAFRYCRATFKLACSKVAEYLDEQLGTSKRGRPSRSRRPKDHASKADTVRAIYNQFHSPLKEHELETHVAMFRHWREWVLQAHSTTLRMHIERVRRDFGSRTAEPLGALIRDVRGRYTVENDWPPEMIEYLRRQREVFSRVIRTI